MLVALDADARRIEARRDLTAVVFRCPECDMPVRLKRGSVVVAHFAHVARGECVTEGESAAHLAAKRYLSDLFRSIGYDVELEERHPGRRVDVAVRISDPVGAVAVAVEVQDSSISLDEMRLRTRLDRRHGFHATMWVFTARRAQALVAAGEEGAEVRVPNEMRYVANLYKHGVLIADPAAGRILHARIEDVDRPGAEYSAPGGTPAYGGDRTLRATKFVTVEDCGPELRPVSYSGKGYNGITVTFST